jgi:hypothetical protein
MRLWGYGSQISMAVPEFARNLLARSLFADIEVTSRVIFHSKPKTAVEFALARMRRHLTFHLRMSLHAIRKIAACIVFQIDCLIRRLSNPLFYPQFLRKSSGSNTGMKKTSEFNQLLGAEVSKRQGISLANF